MIEPLHHPLGEVARVARERLGLTQAELAEKIKLLPEVYERLERGTLIPSIQTVWRLSLVLGISTDVLLGVLPFEGEASLDSALPEGSVSPELRRIFHQLRTWPPERLRMLDKVLSALGSAFERERRRSRPWSNHRHPSSGRNRGLERAAASRSVDGNLSKSTPETIPPSTSEIGSSGPSW